MVHRMDVRMNGALLLEYDQQKKCLVTCQDSVMVQMRSVDDDVGASAMEVSQTDLGRQPTMACDNHPIFYWL